MPQDWRVPNKVLETRPFGVTFGDQMIALRNALMEREQAQAEAQREAAEAARRKLLRSDPYIAQPDELAQRYANRRDVRRVADPDAGPRVARGIRSFDEQMTAPYQPRTGGIRPGAPPPPPPQTPRYETGGLTETRLEAARATDPNAQAALKGRMMEAGIDPRVLAAGAQASGTTEAARIRAQGQVDAAKVRADASGQMDIPGNAKSAQALLGSMSELSKRIHTGEGPGQALGGWAQQGLSSMNMSDDVQLYERLRKPLASALASLVQGARPSDADVQIYSQFLPPPSMGKANAQAMLTAAQAVIENAANTGRGVTWNEMQSIFSQAAASMPRGGGGGEVPPEIGALLQDQPDGRHTLSDGSVWVKQGSQIRKVQ